ncbi:MAG: two component transcriptional regulator, LuxR family [Anaerocolumna sp.]|jgi:NarL family two-component system response regulator YdfI|nr:two component transcriptional regulator, LuxR family [Anaerocolumna sp.]
MEQIKILIVDDHPIVREGLKLIFETTEKFEITGEASNGKDALTLIKNYQYDVILLDIFMPIMDGIEFLQEKERLKDITRVVVLTTSDDSRIINKAMNYGVKSFMLKDSTSKEMFKTILAAMQDERYLSPEVEAILLEGIAMENGKDDIIGPILTEREMVVLRSIVRGAASKEIAMDMGITERTVKAHLTNIYRKLDVNSRSEAVALAIVKKIVIVPEI